MQQRRKSVIRKYAILLTIGVVYLAWVLLTDLGIPCFFNLFFDVQCPGCGATRMILALVKLDFRSAFHYNPFLLVTFPIIFLIIVCSEVAYIRHGSRLLGGLKLLVWLELISALIFGILRNII